MTVYKYSPKKGYVTGSGRPLAEGYSAGLSRTGKTVLIYNREGRVAGRVSNAKESNLGPLMGKVNNYNRDKGEFEGTISFKGITANSWEEYNAQHVESYGYEYH